MAARPPGGPGPASGPADPSDSSGAPAPVRPSAGAEESVLRRTGRPLADWFAALDAWGAARCTHTETARHLTGEHGLPGWWAQHITVAYQQARGLRAPGQRADGRFSASASKTVAAPAERVFAAFADPDLRGAWLPDAELAVRTATAPTSFRADWTADGTLVAAYLTAQAPDRTRVGLQHEKLADSAAAARMKTYWRQRLAALKELLER
ncbi:DUF4287 domain-containing protein [Streptomonospora sp. S1-112]|uniref:DUF4287 domain-containing protein n=1 Tax=Streptomonospora mangrovi TaxID=2883123 RepID=A0A9X3NI51_9ACTN|nr:DUF4287 domain-containing protein [Streptomonospora mangrovi]MDA0563470.1 DUF4287 domain-containing protein [Streptomonospora mangrovi]